MKKLPLIRFYTDNKKDLSGLVVILLISFLAGLLKMAASMLWGQAVDFGTAGEIHGMLVAAGLMAGVILIDCARTAVHYHIIGHVTENMFLNIRSMAFHKITHADVGVLESKFRTGDIATRITTDIDYLSSFAAGSVSDFSRRIFQAAFAIIGCFFLSWQLSLIYCVILPVSLWAIKKVSVPFRAQSKRSLDATGAAMNTASDAISGILTVKAFGLENERTEKFHGSVQRACTETEKSEKTNMKMTGVKYVATVIQTMALFLLGSVLVTNGTITVGTMIAFITLSSYINDPFSMMDYMISTMKRASATAQRIYEVLDIPDEKAGTVKSIVSDEPCAAEDITFSYTEEKQILNGLSVHIGKNQKVAVIGSSGCGKSTLLSLICRFYLPDSGKLTLFGEDSKDWDADALRQNMAIVTQDAYLFDGSIYENIAYGCPGTTRAECEAALKDVGLWEFVCSFPDGMDHEIGEMGGQLSGGQKQRLCIARAMARKAPLVLLDEATSALDAQTEKAVQKALDKLLVGRSAVIVAHRLTTVQNADYIYCLEAGRVLEEGTPRELLDKKGKYYEMCRLQGLVKEAAV